MTTNFGRDNYLVSEIKGSLQILVKEVGDNFPFWVSFCVETSGSRRIRGLLFFYSYFFFTEKKGVERG